MATVLATFSVLKDHVKLKVTEDAVAIDNMVFKLHYRVTFLLLFSASLLVSARQLVGEPISCIGGHGMDGAVVKAISTYCFCTSTYTVVNHPNLTLAELSEIGHPGVGPIVKGDKVVRHAYYQWVPFVLFFQALLFYMPHYLWRNLEGGRLKSIISGLHMASLSLRDTPVTVKDGVIVPSKDQLNNKLKEIRYAFLHRIHLNRPWAYYLGLCEVFNFINVLMQIYLTDWFLGGAFLGLGQAVSHGTAGAVNPLDIVFPKVTKCTFHKYGASGGIQNHDALCVMALNIVNEKIYLFLWYWFIILSVITALGLLWRLLTMLLHARSVAFNKIMFSMASPGKYNPWNALAVTRECHYGDWVFLYYIAKNLDNCAFKELLEKLAEDLHERRLTRMDASTTTPEKEPLTREAIPKFANA